MNPIYFHSFFPAGRLELGAQAKNSSLAITENNVRKVNNSMMRLFVYLQKDEKDPLS